MLLVPVIGWNLGIPSVDFIAFTASSSNLTTYTFSSQGIGTPGNNRWIGVLISGRATGGQTISSVTVDGESISQVVTQWSLGDRVALWAGPVTTGNSTGDIVVTWSSTISSSNIGTFEMHNITGTTGTDTVTTDATDMTASVVDGGVAIAGAIMDGSSCDWSAGDGTNHGIQYDGEKARLSACSEQYAASGTATFNANASSGFLAAALATFY